MPPLVSNRACNDSDLSSNNNNKNNSAKRNHNKKSNLGVTRWQDDAMFSTDSQLFSAPPRAPSSVDSPVPVMTARKRLSSRETTATKDIDATALELGPTVLWNGNSRGNAKQLEDDTSSSSTRSSYQTLRSTTKNLAEISSYLSTTSTTTSSRRRGTGATSPVEALEEALDLVGHTTPNEQHKQRMLVEA
jgi:hypothetical protein